MPLDTFEEALKKFDAFNQTLMTKKRKGETVSPEEYTQIKDMIRGLHTESLDVETPEIGRLLSLYDLGLGVRYLEPNYQKLNEGFAWLESQSGDDDEDF